MIYIGCFKNESLFFNLDSHVFGRDPKILTATKNS